MTNSPERYNQKFSKLNWKKIARRHLMKSQKYCSCNVLLGIITTTITQFNSLLVLLDTLSVDV